jgi:predicted nucleic acid-binding protein
MSKPHLLIDTSGWLSLYHKNEREHETAVELYNNADYYLTHSYILAEFVPLAQVRKLPREKNLQFTEAILNDQSVEIVWVDEELHGKAVELLKNRKDKTYSLCDAVSFVLMHERGIGEALTTDHHFEQEGFVRMLK